MTEVYELLRGILRPDQILKDEPLCRHTTFRIGGPADYMVLPDEEEQVCALLTGLQETGAAYYVMGNGSNLLAADEGFRGVIIQLYRNFSHVSLVPQEDETGCVIEAQAGAMLSAVAKMAGREGYTGMEFASGIPGTIGGAMVMNAGAYGGEMKDITDTVRLLTADGQIRDVPGSEMQFGYRTSLAGKTGALVLGARLVLPRGDTEKIQARMDELKEQRTSKQPLDMPSAGSTFKRPEGYFAGKLIMDAGLRGYRVGGACVSEKHCGFVVNTGDATAADVRRLISDVKRVVMEKFGVELEPEIRMIG